MMNRSRQRVSAEETYRGGETLARFINIRGANLGPRTSNIFTNHLIPAWSAAIANSTQYHPPVHLSSAGPL